MIIITDAIFCRLICVLTLTLRDKDTSSSHTSSDTHGSDKNLTFSSTSLELCQTRYHLPDSTASEGVAEGAAENGENISEKSLYEMRLVDLTYMAPPFTFTFSISRPRCSTQ